MTAQTFFIKSGYVHRPVPDYFEDTVADGVIWQPDVYAAAACLARRLECTHLIDVGCGQAGKLAAMHPEFKIIGADYGPNIENCRQRHPFGQWIETNLETSSSLPLANEITARSVVICADVIEHLQNPTALLKLLHSLLDHAPALVLSTPERDLCRGADHFGPPPNPAHVREWSREEMAALLRYHGFKVDFVGLTTRNSQSNDKRTLIAFAAHNHRPVPLVLNVPWGQAVAIKDRQIGPDKPAVPISKPVAAAPTPPSAMGERLTLLLFVDALRPDYVERTQFLKSLAADSGTGQLRERFGFVQHPAYFGGIPDFPFTNQYCFDPDRSPFQMARALPDPAGQPQESDSDLRQFLDRKAKERLTSYAACYVNSMAAPMAALPFFSVVEQYAPWDSRVGYHSLFHDLDQNGLPWFQCSWPASNRLPDHSDAGIVRHTLASLKPEHRFAFVHLQELDGTGHQFGPNSARLQKQLAHSDALCQQLIGSLRARYHQLDIVLFGDHGMVNVTRTVDVTKAVAATGLKVGIDYVAFLDSTMVRFWFFHTRARRVVTEVLAGLPGGKILDAAALEHYGLTQCDPRNGELVYLADAGVLVFPNFFQAEGEPIKGMHGYDPDSPDNLGFFLCHSSEGKHLHGQNVGKVDAWKLRPLLSRLLGLPLAATESFPLSAAPIQQRGRFTPQSKPAAQLVVQKHMETIVAAIHKRVGPVEAIVLTGSFGRGEGGVYQDDSGAWRPVNDYDIFVVSPKNCSAELKDLGESLVKELGLDYLDLGWTDGQWKHRPLTVANYDLKYGSQVIAGDVAILNRLPAYASAELPIYEAAKLLLNRTAGLLTGLRGDMLGAGTLSADQRRYLSNQIAKAQMALGDSYLIRWGGYDASYRLRRERFAALAPGAGLSLEMTEQVIQGYGFKLNPDYSVYAHPLETIRQLRPHLERAVIEIVNQMADGKTEDLAGAMALYLATMSEDPGWVQSDNAFFLSQPSFRNLLQTSATANVSLRHVVYSALPELLAAAFAASGAEGLLESTRRMLATHFHLPEKATAHPVAWEGLRATTVTAWFAVHH